MKLKKRRFFIIGLIVLLLLGPSSMIFCTLGQQKNYKKKISNTVNTYNLELLAMAAESKTDPDYQPLNFQEGVDEKGQKALNELVKELFDATLNYEQDDDGFYYKAYNKKTHQIYSSKKSTYPVSFKGCIEGSNDSKYSAYSYFDIYSLLNYTNSNDIIDSYYTFSGHTICINDKVKVDLDKVSINPPENMQIDYYFTIALTNMRSSDSDSYIGYFSFALIFLAMLLCIVLFIYILVNPMAVEETINPYKTIKEWKLFTIMFIIGSACLSFMVFSGFICSYTLAGILPSLMTRFGVLYAVPLCYAACFICMLIFYFLYSMLCFTMKYIFTYGLWNYFKDHTLFYVLCKKAKQFVDSLMKFDLKDDYNKTILKLVISNALLVVILYELSPGYTVFAIVYMIISFLYIRKELWKIRKDYNHMLDFTEQLSHGRFDTEIEDDLGIFNSMRNRLNNLKTGFEAAVKEETKSQNMKTELITNVSHDLKTPLTCIKNYVILLENTECDEETRKEYLKQLKTYTNRLANLIQDLFDVSKATSGNIELHPMNLRLSALLDQSIAECVEVLESKDIQIIKNVEDVEAYLDGDKTYRVFENLLTNIGKYAMPHSRAYIDIHDEEDHISVIFKNMSEAEMNFNSEEIQERFVRGDKSRHETGSGLGLAIAKSFVVAQNGTFDIDIDGDLFKVIMTFKKN